MNWQNVRLRKRHYCVELHAGIVLGMLSLLSLDITSLSRKLGQNSSQDAIWHNIDAVQLSRDL